MIADLSIGQGTTTPAYQAVITDAYGYPVNLTGATCKLVMRRLQDASPAVSAAMTITNATSGAVAYDWSASDTATAGLYQVQVQVTESSGATYNWPNAGYQVVEVIPSLSLAPQQLIGIEDAKDSLQIPADDTQQDTKILRMLNGVLPLFEQICGPIVQHTIEEYHDGGHYRITLRRRPSTALGMNPMLVVNAISEYNGPIEWPLAIISTLDEAVLYSALPDKMLGTITRTTAGGGVQSFPNMPDAVHVWYTVGQSPIPDNIQEAAREFLRENWVATQTPGGPRTGGDMLGPGEDFATYAPVPLALSARVRSWLTPSRRAPAVA